MKMTIQDVIIFDDAINFLTEYRDKILETRIDI